MHVADIQHPTHLQCACIISSKVCTNSIGRPCDQLQQSGVQLYPVSHVVQAAAVEAIHHLLCAYLTLINDGSAVVKDSAVVPDTVALTQRWAPRSAGQGGAGRGRAGRGGAGQGRAGHTKYALPIVRQHKT